VGLHHSNNDKTFIDPKDKAKILNNYFVSVFTGEDINYPSFTFPSISPLTIYNEGVNNLLSNLKEHKAKGPDKIPTLRLKRHSVEISPALTQSFQASLYQGPHAQKGKQLMLFRFLKKVTEVTPQIIDLCLLPVCVANCLNMLFILSI